MNKVSILLIIAAVAVLSACAASRGSVGLSSLAGEWDIIEVDETAVVPAPGQAFPYIGFDVEQGRVYGSTGCNLLTGSFSLDERDGRLDLSQLGGTRMLCPDMHTEEIILAALARVKHYAMVDDDHMVLYHSSKKSGLILQRRRPRP